MYVCVCVYACEKTSTRITTTTIRGGCFVIPPNIIWLTRSLPFCSRHKFVNYILCENSHMHERQCCSFTTSYKWPSTFITLHLFLSRFTCARMRECECQKWDKNYTKTLAINGNFRCKAMNTGTLAMCYCKINFLISIHFLCFCCLLFFFLGRLFFTGSVTYIFRKHLHTAVYTIHTRLSVFILFSCFTTI